jgi:hypothetical protein
MTLGVEQAGQPVRLSAAEPWGGVDPRMNSGFTAGPARHRRFPLGFP